MYYKYYSSPGISRSMQSSFLGLNKNAQIGNGEFADMQNMSSDNAPLLSPRQPRMIAQAQMTETDEDGDVIYKNLNGILGDVGFAAVWGNDLYYMGGKVDGITLSDGEKRMLAMGAYILIFPDTVYYNTVNGEYGSIETGVNGAAAEYLLFRDITLNISGTAGYPCTIKYTTIGNSVAYSVTSVRLTDSKYTHNPVFKTDLPTSFVLSDGLNRIYDCTYAVLGVKDGYLYYCSGANVTTKKGSGYDNYGFKKYEYTDCTWTKLDVQYAEIPEAAFTALGFTEMNLNSIWSGDTHVKIEHVNGAYRIMHPDIANVFTPSSMYNGETQGFAITDREYKLRGNALVLSAGQWTAKTMPVLDCVCVHENRLWGCHYGTQVNSFDSVNEIYCSALGDFKTWTLSSETSTLPGDPYTASMGDYGPFTGCISHRGYVLFFKENGIYRVSGTKPSNFQITKISDSGLAEGCEKSMEIIDEVLYYKSRGGVYAYDGSLPQKISDNLGNAHYTDAVAGHVSGKYYISMVSDGVRRLYVYDTQYGLWHVEDGANVRFFTEYEGALYAGVDNDIVCLSGAPAEFFAAAEREEEVEWYAETGDIGLGSPYQKYFHRVLIRMDMDVGARVTAELQCDGGDWTAAMDFTAAHKRSVLLPIVTPRCDHMRMRISGVGNAKIYSISYETETVGERPMRR